MVRISRFSAEGFHGQIILAAQIDGYRGGIVASSVEDLFIRMKSFEPNELILYYPFIDPNTGLSLIHISEPTRQAEISYAVW